MKVRSETYFATVPEWLLYADISAPAVRLYAVLARHANRNGHAHPSRRRLAELMRCSPASVDRAMGELAAIDAVRLSKRFDRETGRQTTNQVWIRTSDPAAPIGLPLITDEEGGVGTDEDGPLSTRDEQNESQEEVGVEVVATPQTSVVPTLAPAARSKRDAIFEVLFELDAGLPYTPENRRVLTADAAGVLNRATQQIAATGIEPEELRAAIGAWPTVFTVTATAAAVKKHLPRLRAAANGLVARRETTDLDDSIQALRRMRERAG